MKLFNIIVLVLAAVFMMMGVAQANPKGGLKKVFKAGKAVAGAASAIGTGHEIYQGWKNRHQG